MPNFALSFAVVLGALILPGQALSASPEELALQSDLNHVWVITAAALVFFMQAGFLLLEAGSVRSKNSVNVAQKNLMDFVVSTVVFGAFGFMLMFGVSSNGWWGWQPDLLFFGFSEEWDITFFIFQLMFCGTAATIMSGAVAERMTLTGYLVATLAIALLIYPIAGHWAWGGLLNGDETPVLAEMGFMDFAGSTVVHSVGAWVALAAIIVIGPRIGKFDEHGNPRRLHGHSPILATLGAIILWVGWIGFNGGSTLSGSSSFASIIANTLIAGGAGGLALMLIGRLESGVFRPDATINGILGGLVAITAGPDVMTSQSAFVVGACGGVVVFGATYLLEHVFKLDDPLGAIAVHGFSGAFGTLAIAFFAPEETLLAGSRMNQFFVQLQGVGLVFAWAFGMSFALLKGIDLLIGETPEGGRGLRVPELHEREGLNQHEHDAPMGTGILQTAMAELARNARSEPNPIELDYGDEAYETSVLLNQIIQNILDERAEEEAAYHRNKAKRMEVEAEISEVVAACAQGDFSKRLKTEGRKDFLLELCKGINTLCVSTEEAMLSIGSTLGAVASGDLAQKMEGDFEGQLGSIQGAFNTTLTQLSEVVVDIRETVLAARQGDFSRSIDLNGKDGFFRDLCSEVNDLCNTSEKGLSELFGVLSRIGDGDLTAGMSDSYRGRYADIGKAVTEMVGGIGSLLSAIEISSDEVAENSDEISQLCDAVVSGSERQSQGLERMTDLLQVSEAASKESVAAAKTANENCIAALGHARTGVEVSRELDLQIGEIAEATQTITEALSQIEDIAMQTKLLGLNASVEAARSGNQGSNEGFKIVAQEVRALADRSSESAGDIRQKVEKVNSAVERGVSLVKQADEVLNGINSAITISSETVNHLTSESETQMRRSEEMTVEAVRISSEATQNFTKSRQSATISSSLKATSSENKTLLRRFKRSDQMDDLAA